MPNPILPMEQPKKPINKGQLGIAACILATTVLIAPGEGVKYDPYKDIIGKETVCYGETNVVMHHYDEAQCVSMLNNAVQNTYAKQVYKCVPNLAWDQNKYQAAASISLAYNIGSTKFCKSTAARQFNHGDLIGGCRALGVWTLAGGKPIQGLINRRRKEVKLCMTGLG